MTTRTPLSRLLPVVFAYAVVIGSSMADAKPTSPPPTTTVTQPAKPEKKNKATPGRTDKADSRKTKSAVRSAKPAKKATVSAVKTESSAQTTSSDKPSQVMDFDTDQVEGQRLEPGYELIEAAPRKAQHRSLVEPLKPGDSVVHRE